MSHEDINVKVCYASVDIFILDILYISFRTNIFSTIIFFAARITIRATCLHFVGAPLPRSSVFCHAAPHYPRQRDIFLTEHLILSMCLHFQQNSSFSQLRLYYPEHFEFQGKDTPQITFFVRTSPSGYFRNWAAYILNVITIDI